MFHATLDVNTVIRDEIFVEWTFAVKASRGEETVFNKRIQIVISSLFSYCVSRLCIVVITEVVLLLGRR